MFTPSSPHFGGGGATAWLGTGRRGRILVPSMAAMLFATLSPVTASPTITDLGTLGGAYTYVRSINAAGQAVGYSQTAAETDRAFVDSGQGLIPLDTLGG